MKEVVKVKSLNYTSISQEMTTIFPSIVGFTLHHSLHKWFRIPIVSCLDMIENESKTLPKTLVYRKTIALVDIDCKEH